MVARAPLITVIIVAYKSGAHLPRCLARLEAQTFRDFEVLVLDNGSSDGDDIDLSALGVPAEVIRSPENIGFAAGNNLLARQARGTWLAFLNPDAFAEPDWLKAFSDAVLLYDGTSVFGSTQLLDSDPNLLDGAGDHYSPLGFAWRGDRLKPVSRVTGDSEVMGPCAAAAFYRRDVFDAAGGFAETFFCYYEDVELGLRLRLAGEHCIQLAGARVRHVASAITGQNSEFSRYHITRNRIWTFLRTMPSPVFHLFLPLLLAQLALIVLLGPIRGDSAVRLRAIRDALAAFPAVMKQRSDIQSGRKAGINKFLFALSWNPLKLCTKEGDRRPIRPTSRVEQILPAGGEHAAD